jgi:hypothetical protein
MLPAGLGIFRLKTGYVKGPKPMNFLYEGCASPQAVSIAALGVQSGVCPAPREVRQS